MYDTREKKPWFFSGYDTVRTKLNTGDYSIEGLEHLITIERKLSVSEFAGNIIAARFYRVLERMRVFRFKFIVCEFSPDDVAKYKHYGTGNITPQFIFSRINHIRAEYGIHVILAGKKSNRFAEHILLKAYKLCQKLAT